MPKATTDEIISILSQLSLCKDVILYCILPFIIPQRQSGRQVITHLNTLTYCTIPTDLLYPLGVYLARKRLYHNQLALCDFPFNTWVLLRRNGLLRGVYVPTLFIPRRPHSALLIVY